MAVPFTTRKRNHRLCCQISKKKPQMTNHSLHPASLLEGVKKSLCLIEGDYLCFVSGFTLFCFDFLEHFGRNFVDDLFQLLLRIAQVTDNLQCRILVGFIRCFCHSLYFSFLITNLGSRLPDSGSSACSSFRISCKARCISSALCRQERTPTLS